MGFYKSKNIGLDTRQERETVDEFLARGGYIKKAVTKYDFIGSNEKKFIPDNQQIRQFYESVEWSNLKKGYYQKCYRENMYYCQQCGCSNQTMMRVDHIRSVRYNWELRVDPNNIQILCFKCNREKKSTEYRATGAKKCEIGCKKCNSSNKKISRYGYEDEMFCSEEAISRWLEDRNQQEIDDYISSQIMTAENNLKKYYGVIS
jgi:hypothetical protein